MRENENDGEDDSAVDDATYQSKNNERAARAIFR